MNYNVLTTVADCDQCINLAQARKDDFLFEQTVIGRELTGQAKATASNNASLITVNAQITGTEAAIGAMAEGEPKDDMISKLRRLNDRKDNLEETLRRGGNASLLLTEMDAELVAIQVTKINEILAGVEARKGQL